MTTYHVLPGHADASDAFNGLSPDCSHATDKPWKTLGKVLNTGSPVVPGDEVTWGPGQGYEGATITVIAGVASVGSPTSIRGDPMNMAGFKDAAGVKIEQAPAACSLRAVSDGLDDPPTVTGYLLTLTTNNPKGLRFYDMFMEGGLLTAGGLCVANVNTTGSSDFLWQDCELHGFNILFYGNLAAAAARNMTFRGGLYRCSFALNTNINIAALTADADLAVLFENLKVHGRLLNGLLAASGGNLAGGVRFKGVTCEGGTAGVHVATTALRVSTVMPVRLEGCTLIGGAAVNAGTAGQVVDDGYCRFCQDAVSTNFTKHATSRLNPMMNFWGPNHTKWGLAEPRADQGGWNDWAADAQKFSGYTRALADFFGHLPNQGAGPSIGCFEVPDLIKDTTGVIGGVGGSINSARFKGAFERKIFVAVDPDTLTLSVRVEAPSYGGTAWPELIVKANAALGIMTDKVVAATSAAEQTITTPSLGITGKGAVEVRLKGANTSTTSFTYFKRLTTP